MKYWKVTSRNSSSLSEGGDKWEGGKGEWEGERREKKKGKIQEGWRKEEREEEEGGRDRKRKGSGRVGG